MKHVMSNGDCAHTYFHQRCENDYARGNSNSFEGPEFYSYRAHIATQTRGENGEDIVLLSSDYDGYSVTTARHYSQLRYAGNHWTQFTVPHIAEPINVAQHRENWQHLRSRYNGAILDATHVREPKQRYVDNIRRIGSECDRYAQAFGLPERIAEPEDVAQLERDLDAIQARRDAEHALAQARAEADCERVRQETELAHMRHERRMKLARFLPWIKPDPRFVRPNYHTQMRDATDRKTDAQKLAEWRKGTRTSLGWNFAGGPYLRLTADRETVQSSGGVSFPASDCPIVWRLIQRARDGKTFARGLQSQTIKLGRYTVDSISSDGTVKAGCHTVSYAECRRIAVELGLERLTLRERVLGLG